MKLTLYTSAVTLQFTEINFQEFPVVDDSRGFNTWVLHPAHNDFQSQFVPSNLRFYPFSNCTLNKKVLIVNWLILQLHFK